MVREYKNDLVYQRQSSEREHMIDLMLLGIPVFLMFSAYGLKSIPTLAILALSLPLLLVIYRILLLRRENRRAKFTIVKKLNSNVDYHRKRFGLVAIHLKSFWKTLLMTIPFTGILGWLAIWAIGDGLGVLSVVLIICALLSLFALLIFLFIAFLKFIWWSNYKSKGLRFDEFKFSCE